MALWPIGVYFAAVIVLVGGIVALSYTVGQRHQERATGFPFESGILSEGSARVRFSSQFFLVAMFFVIFDVEAIFVFAWAIAGRQLGWTGYWALVSFIAVLLIALIYLARLGALEWGPRQRNPRTKDSRS